MNKCFERVCGFGVGCEVFYGNDLENFESFFDVCEWRRYIKTGYKNIVI